MKKVLCVLTGLLCAPVGLAFSQTTPASNVIKGTPESVLISGFAKIQFGQEDVATGWPANTPVVVVCDVTTTSDNILDMTQIGYTIPLIARMFVNGKEVGGTHPTFLAAGADGRGHSQLVFTGLEHEYSDGPSYLYINADSNTKPKEFIPGVTTISHCNEFRTNPTK